MTLAPYECVTLTKEIEQMNKLESTELMNQFKSECSKQIQCPYCGRNAQLDPDLGCCDEVHAEEGWTHPKVGNFRVFDWPSAFQDWLYLAGKGKR